MSGRGKKNKKGIRTSNRQLKLIGKKGINKTSRQNARRLLRLKMRRENRELAAINRRIREEVTRIEQNIQMNLDGRNRVQPNPETAIALQTFGNRNSWLYFTPQDFQRKIIEIMQQSGMNNVQIASAHGRYGRIHTATGGLFLRICTAKIQEISRMGLIGNASASARKKLKRKVKSVINKLKKKREILSAFVNFEQSAVINNDEQINFTIHQYSKWIGNIFGYTPHSFRKNWLNKVQDKAQCIKMIQHRQRVQSGETKTPSGKQALGTYYNNKRCYICSGYFNDHTGRFIDGRTPECEHILPIFLALRHLWIVRKNDISEYTEDQLGVLNEEYEFSHRCCNQCKSDLSFIQFYTVTNTRLNQCRIDSSNIDVMFGRILHHSRKPSWGCDVIMRDFLDTPAKIQAAKINLSKRLQTFVDNINGFINNQEFGFGGNVVEYLAWTKLKALTCLSNWELFELFTEEDLSESILNRIPEINRGGSKSDDSIETNKLFLHVKKILHSPAITDKEIIFNTLLNYGCNIEGHVFEPPEINYNDNGTSTIKMVLNGIKIVQTVESLDAVKNNFLKPIDFTLYRLKEAPEIPSIYEDIDTENSNNTLQVFFNNLIDMMDINTVQAVSPEIISTDLVNKSISTVQSNNVRDLISSFTSTGIPLQQAANETASTIKYIRSIANQSGLNLSVQQSANVALNLVKMKTGRNISELSMIPEEQTLSSLVNTTMPISVMGGKKKRKRSRKKRKKKKKRTRRRKK